MKKKMYYYKKRKLLYPCDVCHEKFEYLGLCKDKHVCASCEKKLKERE